MLLACCFREPKTNKRSKKSKKSSEDDENETVRKVTAHVEPTRPAVTQIKEEVKLQQNSVIKPSFNASTPLSKYPTPAQQAALSPNFTNISAIKKKEEVKDVRRMLATPEDLDESYVSLSKINNDSSKDSFSLKKTETEENKSNSEEKSRTFVKEENIKLTEFNEENLKLKEIIEHQKLKLEKQEKSIKSLSNECQSMVETLKNEYNSRLQEEKNCHHLKLLEEKEKHRKEIENAKIIAKNSANETISQLNKQIVAERAKMFAEQQDTKKRMEEEFKMKEDRLQQSLACLEQSLTIVEKRELEWQEEKADILEEVQRLKAEANKMIQIFAEDYEEENLSEEKKRSLSAEVYSLQLVVEMRTGEVRSLREKLGIVTHQMESQAVTQSQLDKAMARIEDLEEQLKQKVVKEQRISAEKWELESSVSESTKKMERMSMNVEELQWRIRNNFELPVDIYSKSPDKSLKFPFTDNNNAEIRLSAEDNIQDKDSNKVIEASSALNQKSGDLIDDTKVVATNDTSPSSDVCMNYDTIHDIQEEDEELSDGNNNLTLNNDDERVDVNSLDEGLGDISSDSGGTESPQLKLNIHESIINNNSEEKQDDKNNVAVVLPTETGMDEKDGRPSRISFDETPL